MRRIILAMGILAASPLFLCSRGYAQESEQLPQVEVPGKRQPPANSDNCSKAPSGSSQNLNCLNQQLKQQVDQINPPSVEAPLNAGSSDTKIGIVNLPAVQQQYGQNYGHSIYPYRPPPLVYGSPLGRH
jgi:hypothetical protein